LIHSFQELIKKSTIFIFLFFGVFDVFFLNVFFCFIVIPGFRLENIPSYKTIQTNENEVFISIEQIKNSSCVSKINNAIIEKISIEDYFKKFEKSVTSVKKQTIKQKIIIEQDNSPVNEDTVVDVEIPKKGGTKNNCKNKLRRTKKVR
jgi:hypothetical protein